jgi:hypothetical protein
MHRDARGAHEGLRYGFNLMRSDDHSAYRAGGGGLSESRYH